VQSLRHVDTVSLLGWSRGGPRLGPYVATHPEKVDRLVLLAPAVMFAKPGHHLLPPEKIEEWRRRGSLPFFHYAYDAERPLNYSFYEDSLSHDAFSATVRQPVIIFQGLRDASVDYRTVEAFARARPNVTLSLLDDDHQLIDSLPRIWDGVAEFLGLTS
jgi:pimeloyl-ACP methyl ester carboxylesterase